MVLADAFDKARQVKFLRPDAVERRQHAAEHMIAAADRAGPLKRPEIADGFHHHDHMGVALGIGANRAGIAGVQIAAFRADHHAFAGDAHGVGERRQQRLAFADEMQRRPARRARAEPRQAGQQLHEPFDFRPNDRGRHRSA